MVASRSACFSRFVDWPAGAWKCIEVADAGEIFEIPQHLVLGPETLRSHQNEVATLQFVFVQTKLGQGVPQPQAQFNNFNIQGISSNTNSTTCNIRSRKVIFLRIYCGRR